MTPYYQDQWVTLYCADCAAVLPTLDRHDLLLTDPPYGISWQRENRTKRQHNGWLDYGYCEWDQVRPTKQVFLQMLLLGSKQIVWGGNYFSDLLPVSRCWLSWHKAGAMPSMSDIDLAWTNLDKPSQQITHSVAAMNNERAGHPTQKPLRLMSWCIEQAGDVHSILDPFAGSGTTLVAAKLRNIKAAGIEREERYCEIAAQRLAQEVLNFT